MNKRFILTVAIIVAALLGIFWFSTQKTDAPSGNSTAEASNHVKGGGTSGVRLVEYGDFQCPACGSYYPMLKQILESHGDQIIFQFRHFPIVQIHPNAMAAHRAAEAAGKQGKFFEMHDLLYERQQLWTSSQNVAPTFEIYAEELALNIEQYKQDVASEAVFDTINADLREGQKLNAASTPTFVLDGKKIENPRSVEDFIKLIDDAIKAKTTGQSQ